MNKLELRKMTYDLCRQSGMSDFNIKAILLGIDSIEPEAKERIEVACRDCGSISWRELNTPPTEEPDRKLGNRFNRCHKCNNEARVHASTGLCSYCHQATLKKYSNTLAADAPEVKDLCERGPLDEVYELLEEADKWERTFSQDQRKVLKQYTRLLLKALAGMCRRGGLGGLLLLAEEIEGAIK